MYGESNILEKFEQTCISNLKEAGWDVKTVNEGGNKVYTLVIDKEVPRNLLRDFSYLGPGYRIYLPQYPLNKTEWAIYISATRGNIDAFL